MKTRAAGGLAAAILVTGAVAWIAAADVGSASTHTLELKQVDVGYAVGTPGLKARLVLASGEAVEYEVGDAEAQSFLRLAELFLTGRARMFADVDGGHVRGVHVSGPSFRGAP